MRTVFLALFLPVLFFASLANISSAATLYMDPNNAELKRGDTMVVSVRLDAGDDECVNAVDAVITYTENIQPVDISRGNSIFSIWVEEPKINKANRTISFAGGIPNGYCGRIPGDPRLTNNVVDLLFQSPGLQIGSSESGNDVKIEFSPETKAYLNDGFGTIAPLNLFGSHVLLSRDAGSVTINPWKDIVESDDFPPERFSITLEKTTNAFSNKYFITFNSTDKQSGIDHYEVIEEPLNTKNLFGWGATTAPWIVAVSPYILDDQSLNSTIRVKAIDKAGNEYIAVYVPEENKRTISFDNIIIFIVLGVLILLIIGMISFIVYFLKKRKIEKNDSINDDEIE